MDIKCRSSCKRATNSHGIQRICTPTAGPQESPRKQPMRSNRPQQEHDNSQDACDFLNQRNTETQCVIRREYHCHRWRLCPSRSAHETAEPDYEHTLEGNSQYILSSFAHFPQKPKFHHFKGIGDKNFQPLSVIPLGKGRFLQIFNI